MCCVLLYVLCYVLLFFCVYSMCVLLMCLIFNHINRFWICEMKWICVCVCMYVCTYVYVYICMYVYVYIYIYECMYVFLNTLILCSSFIVRDQASHLYETTGKIMVLYISGQQTGRQNILHWMIASIPWFQSALNFFLNIIFIFSSCSPIFELFHPFKETIINLLYCDFFLHSDLETGPRI